MGSDTSGSAVVTGRATRLVTTGCLTVLAVLIVVLGTAVSWLWYRGWHDPKVNDERRDEAYALIRRDASDTAEETARALGTAGTTDADALTEVIWRHSQAPVITYDASRHEFSATAASDALYDTTSILGGGSDRVSQCFVVTYTRDTGRTWSPRVSERDADVCRPATAISGSVHHARTRIANMYTEDLTRAGVSKALDPTGRQRTYDVRSAAREDDTVTVAVLVSSPDATTTQCYRFTRPVQDVAGPNSAEEVPALSC
ncbi:hypothetical protein SHKM778_27540 [Streptomyces sp. KM77-8]|uniref:Sensor domain-containing protein n=1 Tax=Streptomyces haneummycinicus TaxID=3074435 RepID=A0AAT9HGD8_9ACTN